jgi:catechol 2,3-dioxygenase-like lactoylglutathione lyase family enzyme
MIDHVGISVADITVSKPFYEQALEPLGYKLIMEVTAEQTGGHSAAGFGAAFPDFWIGQDGAPSQRTHVALRAKTRAEVDAFHAAALAAGGRDNGAPGLRPHYHEHYYGAFVLDPDGHNIEAVCHAPGDPADQKDV